MINGRSLNGLLFPIQALKVRKAVFISMTKILFRLTIKPDKKVIIVEKTLYRLPRLMRKLTKTARANEQKIGHNVLG